jgi:putative glycosyltransferase (TIGR04348 family)
MRIRIVTPAGKGSRSGNRVTAKRWARTLQDLGHVATVQTAWAGEACDLLVVQHARRGAASIRRFRRERPDGALAVALTGTDQYVDLLRGSRAVAHSLDAATRIIALQPMSKAALPPRWRRKAHVIPQSALAPRGLPPTDRSRFLVVNLAHLRPVKDPFLLARAVRRLPEDSRIEVLHAGDALSPAMERRAIAETRRNPRWRWVRGLSRPAALRLLSRARILVIPSRAEGASGVLVEALAVGTPVLATRIEGVTGVIGRGYRGLFDVGDSATLARLLVRAERDAGFLRALRRACRERARDISPQRERAAWRELLASLERRARMPAPPGS